MIPTKAWPLSSVAHVVRPDRAFWMKYKPEVGCFISECNDYDMPVGVTIRPDPRIAELEAQVEEMVKATGDLPYAVISLTAERDQLNERNTELAGALRAFVGAYLDEAIETALVVLAKHKESQG